MGKRERLQIIFEMNFPFSFDYCHIHVSQTPKMSGDKIQIICCGKKRCIEMFVRHEKYI